MLADLLRMSTTKTVSVAKYLEIQLHTPTMHTILKESFHLITDIDTTDHVSLLNFTLSKRCE